MASGELPPLYRCRDRSIVDDPSRCRGGYIGVLGSRERVALSKRMAGLLRHFPHRYGLKIDREGWASVRDLVIALRASGYPWAEEWHVVGIALYDPKGRYELRKGMIRARYGHSIDVSVNLPRGEAPAILYHGTPLRNLPSIMEKGLLPGRRLMVHLTSNVNDAIETGARHGKPVAILEVDVNCLREKGLEPMRAGKTVYVVKRVPSECLRVARVAHLHGES